MANVYSSQYIWHLGVDKGMKQLHEVYDSYFRDVCNEATELENEPIKIVADSGNVECDSGYFWLLEVTAKCAIDIGWYVVVTESNGFWYAHEAPSEAVAREIYGQLEKQYIKWDSQDDDDDDRVETFEQTQADVHNASARHDEWMKRHNKW